MIIKMHAIEIEPRKKYLWKGKTVMITRIIDPGFKAVCKGKSITVFAEDLKPIKQLRRRK